MNGSHFKAKQELPIKAPSLHDTEDRAKQQCAGIDGLKRAHSRGRGAALAG
jgi:hypothetical protein